MTRAMVLSGSARNRAERAEIGGKAANLLALEEYGLPVPPWVVLPWDSVRRDSTDELAQALSDFLPDTESFAVRSSAALEDGALDSYAGIFESRVGIPRRDLAGAISAVRDSATAPRVSEYRHSRGLPTTEVPIAVIVQKFVPAEVSGVAFGINPLTGETGERVIEVVAGPGEGLVSGCLDSDQFIVRGTYVERRPRQAPGLASLSESEVLEIARTLDRLASKFGAPQDIEFVRQGGKIVFLQSRPVTATGSAEIVWENNNLIESYPGMTTPLTFSFVRKTYEIGYRQVSAMLGIPRATIDANAERYAGMIGLLRNRMYYNLTNILAITRTLPGSSILEGAFVQAIGIEGEPTPVRKKFATIGPFLRFAARTAGRLVVLFFRLPAMRRTFVADLDRILEGARRIPLSDRSFEEVVAIYRGLERSVFSIWRAPVVNGLFTMVFFRALGEFVARLGLNETRPNLRNELLVGAENIVSTEPIVRIARLTENIRRDPPAFALFSERTPAEIRAALGTEPFARLRAEVDDSLLHYGDRCIGGELKLETPSYRKAPENFLRIVQSYVTENVKLSFDSGRNQEIRATAEREVDRRLAHRPVARFFFRAWLEPTRSMVVWRENLRFKRSQAFGVVKSIFADLGEKLVAEGKLEKPADVFFLTVDEVFSRATDLKPRIESRRAFYRANLDLGLPARVHTRGPVDPDREPNLISERKPDDSRGVRKTFRGVGCSSGIVRGKIRIIRSPEDVQSLGGDILVTESTDPGWVKLFPTASAILLERGSLLSHAGIVTREMGIPCVVGVKGLLASLRDEDVVELNGSTGEVRILS